MSAHDNDARRLGRRDFFKAAGAGLATAGVLMTPREQALAQSMAEKARLDRLAGCTWPIRSLFKTRQQAGRGRRPGRRRRRWWRTRGRGRAGRAGRAGTDGDRRRRADSDRSRQPRQHAGRGDEEEVRRDHDAGLPAVDQGQLPGRHADGSVLRALRRRDRRQHVHDGRRRRRRWRRVQSDEPVRPEVPRAARQHPGEDRDEDSARLEQRAVRPGRLRIARGRRAPQGRRRDGQAVARGVQGPRCRVDAHELDLRARTADSSERSSTRRRRVSAQSRHRSAHERRHRVLQGDGGLSAATSASRSRSRTTGGSPPIR